MKEENAQLQDAAKQCHGCEGCEGWFVIWCQERVTLA